MLVQSVGVIDSHVQHLVDLGQREQQTNTRGDEWEEFLYHEVHANVQLDSRVVDPHEVKHLVD